MADLRLTAAARADLVEIRRYSIVEFGGNVADIYFRGFKDAFALCARGRSRALSDPICQKASGVCCTVGTKSCTR